MNTSTQNSLCTVIYILCRAQSPLLICHTVNEHISQEEFSTWEPLEVLGGSTPEIIPKVIYVCLYGLFWRESLTLTGFQRAS